MASRKYRRVRIVKRKVIHVSNELLALFDDPETIRVWCSWCRSPKADYKKACEVCGLCGNSSTPESTVSRVYVEQVRTEHV